jgi:ribosomal protein L27
LHNTQQRGTHNLQGKKNGMGKDGAVHPQVYNGTEKRGGKGRATPPAGWARRKVFP